VAKGVAAVQEILAETVVELEELSAFENGGGKEVGNESGNLNHLAEKPETAVEEKESEKESEKAEGESQGEKKSPVPDSTLPPDNSNTTTPPKLTPSPTDPPNNVPSEAATASNTPLTPRGTPHNTPDSSAAIGCTGSSESVDEAASSAALLRIIESVDAKVDRVLWALSRSDYACDGKCGVAI
jgi:hypothetical protein